MIKAQELKRGDVVDYADGKAILTEDAYVTEETEGGRKFVEAPIRHVSRSGLSLGHGAGYLGWAIDEELHLDMAIASHLEGYLKREHPVHA